MKNVIIVLFALLIAPSCMAQSQLTSGRFNINGVFFNVKQSGYDKSSYSIRADWKYGDVNPGSKTPNPLPIGKEMIHFDMQQLKNIFYDKVAYKREKLSKEKVTIGLRIDFEEDGSVAGTSYLISSDTAISLQEIAAIDKQIKTTIKATFTGPSYVDYYVIPYPYIHIWF